MQHLTHTNRGTFAGEWAADDRNKSNNLRRDVIKKFDIANEPGRKPIMAEPAIGFYLVRGDNQEAPNPKTILPYDNVVGELITMDKIRPGKFYIVIDKVGNVLLSLINEVTPGKSLKLINLNKAYRDQLIRRCEILAIVEVFQVQRKPHLEYKDYDDFEG